MSKFLRISTLWLWGGFVYYVIETLWRGHSHPSMFVVGGLCFLLIGGLNNHLPWDMSFLLQSLLGAAIVTVAELVSGVILNIVLGLGVWDYSRAPLNLWGQVCLPFSLLWALVSAFAIWLDDYLRWKLFAEEKPRYTLI
jgi:uncharacterized membrane protein